MRKLTTISGLLIVIFLVNAIGKYPDDFTKRNIAIGAALTVLSLIVIKLRPGEQKKKGYILRG